MLSNITINGTVSKILEQSNTPEGKLTGTLVMNISKIINKQTGETGTFPILVNLYGENLVIKASEAQLDSPIIIAGTLMQKEYENADGSKFKSIVIDASHVLPNMPMDTEINTLAVVGRLGQEPELKYFESGSSVASTTLAFNHAKNQTSWFGLKAWGKCGEILAQYAKKGSQIGAQGNLDFEQWINKETGALNQKASINMSRLELLGEKSGGSSESAQMGVPNSDSKPVESGNTLF